MSIIFDRVKELANKRGYSLNTLEEKLGIGTNSLYGLKTKKPNAERLQQLADHFNVSVDYLLGRTDEKKYWELNAKDERDIETKINDLIADLDGIKFSKEGGEYSEETVELIRMALEQGARIAKMEAKRKFTNKKYRGGEAD